MITKKAFAKVNLGLDITGRRDDGYHLVRMIMQSVEIFDILTFEATERPDIEIIARSDIHGQGDFPLGQDNLIYKAAARLIRENNISKGVRITIEKNIPIAAGLAGGSSDCAAALRGVNELFSLGLSDEELMKTGVTLGADVPYCILGGTALSEGIGELLTPLKPLPDCTFLVIKPDIAVSTAEAYGGYDALVESGGVFSHPDIDSQLEALKEGKLEGVAAHFGNVLELVTGEKYPVIRQIESIMKENGALNAMMSGSGPTVFGIFKDRGAAEEAARAVNLEASIESCFVVKSCGNNQ